MDMTQHTKAPIVGHRGGKAWTQAELSALAAAAEQAWSIASPPARVVRFSWRGRRYRSDLTTFRVRIQTPDGTPVASYYR